MLKTVFAMQPRYLPNFLWLLLLYALVILALFGTGEEKFEHLHLILDISNAILSLLLMLFLLGEQHQIQPNMRKYLVVGFGFAAATELLHALIGIEWSGWFAWIQSYSGTLRPATWPPSTYVLPFAMAWAFWLMRRNSALRPALFAAGIALLTAGLFALSFWLPRYVDTGILGIQRPTQVPLLLLWAGVIAAYWRERRTHPLYEGLALMGVLLFLSDLCMLYSTSPHEKFTMMAHAGKMIAYALLHVIQMHIAAEDSRGRSAAESTLRENEASMRAILDNSPYMSWLKNPTGRYVRINKVYADYVRLKDARQIIGKTDFDLWPEKLAEKYRADDADVIATRQHKHVEELSFDGSKELWVETFKTPIIDENGNVLGTTGFARNITERKQAEAELRIAAIAFEAQDGMMITDAHSVILRVNHAFTEITGYTSEEAVGQTPRLLGSDRQDAAFYAAMWKSIRLAGTWHGEIWNRRKNGEVYPEQLTITAVKGNTGKTTHYVATLRDITQRKAAEKEIYNLAFYDTLTKIPNRSLLDDRLRQAMAASKRSGMYGALMFLDLDNFKPLNDTYGHDVGDLLLMEAACRIASCVREVDTVARFGGDEFVVMLSELNEDKAESAVQSSIVAEKIRTILAQLYVLKSQHEGNAETTVEHRCTSSIGVVLFINHEASPEDVLKWADMAMYQAKEGGRNRVHFYNS